MSPCRKPPARRGWRALAAAAARLGMHEDRARPHRRRPSRDRPVPYPARDRHRGAGRHCPTSAAVFDPPAARRAAGADPARIWRGASCPLSPTLPTRTAATPGYASGTTCCRSWRARTRAWSRRSCNSAGRPGRPRRADGWRRCRRASTCPGARSRSWIGWPPRAAARAGSPRPAAPSSSATARCAGNPSRPPPGHRRWRPYTCGARVSTGWPRGRRWRSTSGRPWPGHHPRATRPASTPRRSAGRCCSVRRAPVIACFPAVDGARRKLSDLLIDAKIPRERARALPVLCDGGRHDSLRAGAAPVGGRAARRGHARMVRGARGALTGTLLVSISGYNHSM